MRSGGLRLRLQNFYLPPDWKQRINGKGVVVRETITGGGASSWGSVGFPAWSFKAFTSSSGGLDAGQRIGWKCYRFYVARPWRSPWILSVPDSSPTSFNSSPTAARYIYIRCHSCINTVDPVQRNHKRTYFCICCRQVPVVPVWLSRYND
jgi:hypothetical protein